MKEARHRFCYFLAFFHLCLIWPRAHGDGSYSPIFEKQVITEDIADGYWIEAFQPNDLTPRGLIAYGMLEGEINFYSNPYITREKVDPVLIQKLASPIAMEQVDISGDGFQDIVICFDYGKTVKEFNIDGGQIVWLENPGKTMGTEPWKRHYVGRAATMHRLKVGHFTQSERWEIVGLPIVNGTFDVPVPVLLFRQPNDIWNATAWDYEIIDRDYFHIIHEATLVRAGPLDRLIVASREGLNWLYYNVNSQLWEIQKIAEGTQEYRQQTNYYGSGGVDVGRIGTDSMAYIAALEPFHGHVVSVYTKSINRSTEEVQWQRNVLDVYGYPDENGEGPGHHVVCADFDKDGEEEFLVALRGPAPNEGVYYYKPIDPSRGWFAKWKVSNDSAARIAIADFDYDGFLDFATVGYYVPGYYVAEKPSISVFYNRLFKKMLGTQQSIHVTKHSDELLFTVPRPHEVLQYHALPFLNVGGITLSLEVLPPHSSRQIDNATYVKVLAGMITWTDSVSKLSLPVNRSRTFLCEPKSVCSMAVLSDDSRIKTQDQGALLLVLRKPQSMSEIPRFDLIRKILLENALPEHYPEEARQLDFKFIKAEELGWGKDRFQGLEFYNMRGFNIRFADNNEHLCHIQLWAAGTGTNAGVHNHAGDRFCEVHACIVNGNGNSGMHYLRSSEEVYDPLSETDSRFVPLPVPSFHEHGPLWDIDAKKQPVLRTDGAVVYPWHKWQSGADGCIEHERRALPSISDIVRNKANTSMGAAPVTGTLLRRCRQIPTPSQSFDVWIAFEFNIKLAGLHK